MCTDGIVYDRKILEMFQAQRSAAINWIGWKFINAKVYNYSYRINNDQIGIASYTVRHINKTMQSVRL